MKWLARFSIFFLSLTVGLLVAALSSLTWQQPILVTDLVRQESEPQQSAKPPTGIKVMYEGWETATATTVPSLKFVIHNGTFLPISYAAHTSEGPWPMIRIDGKEQEPIFGCGTGIQTFYILPGASAEVIITPDDFTGLPAKGQTVSAGFYLRRLAADNVDVHFSEAFLLPDEFRQEIRVWKAPL
jgi:hypothetical protein